MCKYSFMVPVYNKEEFLKKYFHTLQNQTFGDYEIVVVDDFSLEDGSFSFLLQLAENDPRIKLYRNAVNLGTGMTRNELISRATGEYLIFVDPDDYIEEQLLEKIEETLQQEKDLEVIRFQNVVEPATENQSIVEETKNPYRFCCEPTPVITGEEALMSWMLGINKLNTMPWTYCIKSNLYNGATYPATNILEDFPVTHYILAKAKKCKAIPYVGYHYLQYDDSLTKEHSSSKGDLERESIKVDILKKVVDFTSELILSTDISKEAKRIFLEDIKQRYLLRKERLLKKRENPREI